MSTWDRQTYLVLYTYAKLYYTTTCYHSLAATAIIILPMYIHVLKFTQALKTINGLINETRHYTNLVERDRQTDDRINHFSSIIAGS